MSTKKIKRHKHLFYISIFHNHVCHGIENYKINRLDVHNHSELQRILKFTSTTFLAFSIQIFNENRLNIKEIIHFSSVHILKSGMLYILLYTM